MIRSASVLGLSLLLVACGSSFQAGDGATTTGATTTTTTTTATTTTTGDHGGAGAGGASVTGTAAGGAGHGGEGGGVTSTSAGGAGSTSNANACDGVPQGTFARGGHCYAIVHMPTGLTHEIAAKVCETVAPNRKSYLARLGDAAEQAAIEAQLPKANDYWIGLECPASTEVTLCNTIQPGPPPEPYGKAWRWPEDSIPPSYLDWSPGQPAWPAAPPPDARCAVLTLPPPGDGSDGTWSWSPRSCTATAGAPPNVTPRQHDYVCEIE